MPRVGAVTEGDVRMRERNGREAVLLCRAPPTPPKWRSALATYLGVLPTALVLGRFLSPWIAGWPFVLRVATFNAAVVAGAYWIVMPVVLRVLRGWLTPAASPRSRCRTP